MKYFTVEKSDSNTSKDTVFCIEPINPLTKKFFADIDTNLPYHTPEENSRPPTPDL